jgi:hypothetical protein
VSFPGLPYLGTFNLSRTFQNSARSGRTALWQASSAEPDRHKA